MSVLANLRSQRAAAYDRAKQVADVAASEGRHFTESEQRAYDAASGDLDALDERIAQVTESDARQHRTESTIADLLSRPLDSRSPGPTSPPSLSPSADVLAQLHGAVTSRAAVRLGTTEERATVLSTDTGADQLAVQLAAGRREPRRIAVAAGIGSQNVAGVTSVEYPVFGAGAAAITGEGASKSEYDAITPGSTNPVMIAIWTDTSRQNLLTMEGFEARLRTVLTGKVASREDELLLTTVTGTSGIQTLTGELSADLVLEAAAMVAASEVGAEPNLVAVNPADVPTLVGTDVGTGGSASPALASFLPNLHGLSVYPTNHVVAGEAVLGAWGAASRFVVGLEPMMLTDAVSGLKTNEVTLLLEEAVALAVDEPQAFLHITAAA